jgi:hypothetical protein
LKKLWIAFWICWSGGLIGIMLASEGYGDWTRILAIVFTLAGLIVGFTMFGLAIKNRYFPSAD